MIQKPESFEHSPALALQHHTVTPATQDLMFSIPSTRLLAFCLATPAVLSAQPNWERARPVAKPGALSDLAMAYDSARQRVVMFGGALNGSKLKDNWVYVTNNPATYTSLGTGRVGSAGVPRRGADGTSLPWVGSRLVLEGPLHHAFEDLGEGVQLAVLIAAVLAQYSG